MRRESEAIIAKISFEAFRAAAAAKCDNCDSASVAQLFRSYSKADADLPEPYLVVPGEDEQTLSCAIGTSDAVAINRARKWCIVNKYTCRTTIVGECIELTTADALRRFLQLVPVRSQFDDYCARFGVTTTPALYHRFCTELPKQCYCRSNYHPFLPQYREFWQGTEEELSDVLSYFVASENAANPVPSRTYCNIDSTAQALGVSITCLLSWLRNHSDCYENIGGAWLMKRTWVNRTAANWSTAVRLSAIAEAIANELCIPAGRIRCCVSEVTDWCLSTKIGVLDCPQAAYTGENRVPLSNRQAIADYLMDIPVFPVTAKWLQDVTKLPCQTLQQMAIEGRVINASPPADGKAVYLVSARERARIETLAKSLMAVDDVVCSMHTSDAYSHNNLRCREALLGYLDGMDWFGIDHFPGEDYPLYSGRLQQLIYASDAANFAENIAAWLRAYGQPFRVQLQILLDKWVGKFPRTVKAYRRFIGYREVERSMVEAADTLFYVLSTTNDSRELATWSETEISGIVQHFADYSTLAAAHVLADFLLYSKVTTRQYTFSGRATLPTITSAYNIADYAYMVQCIVNDTTIATLDLVRKAQSRKRFAQLWLFVALHVFSAWRSTDYVRLSAPSLPVAPEAILTDGISDNNAAVVADIFMVTQSVRYLKPHKTSSSSGVPPLYFHCPESCKIPFGRILAIAAAHHALGSVDDNFVAPINDRTAIIEFFGTDFAAACGNRNFSTRRANKALLQAVETETREGGHCNPLVAYTMASHMRSHKVGYGEYSPTTDIYLRDANFAGASAEYVVSQMYARGVCSFYVDALLKQVYPAYQALSINGKTQAIQAVGIHVCGISNIVDTVTRATEAAIDTVRELVADATSATHALEAIALGCAHGKDMNTQCIAKAAGTGCQNPARANCFGCRYEIKSRALLLQYLYAHYTIGNGPKQTWIDDNIIVPAIAEIAAHLREHLSDEDYQRYTALVEAVAKEAAEGETNHGHSRTAAS